MWILAAALASAAHDRTCCRPVAAESAYAQRYRIWMADGTPAAIIAFRFPLSTGTTGSLTIRVRESDSLRHVVIDSTWSPPSAELRSVDGRAEIGGFVVLPYRGDLSRWRVTLNPASNQRPIDVQRSQSTIDDGGITMSDLMAGTPGMGATWAHDSGQATVPLGDSYDHLQPIHLFYQVRSASSHARVHTTLTLTNISNAAHGRRVMQVDFHDQLAAGIDAFDRNIDPSRLPRGRYRLELQVADLDGGGASVRAVEFRLR